MRPSPSVSETAPTRISSKQKSRWRVTPRLQLPRTLSAPRLLRTVSAEVFEAAAVVVADAAMGEATDGARDVIEERSGGRSRVLPGLRWKVLLLRLFLGFRNQAGPSSSDRPQGTSRYCFLENRFPSTAAWCSRQRRRSGVPSRAERKCAQQLRPSQPLRRLWPRLSRTMNRSSPLPAPALLRLPKREPKRRGSGMTIQKACVKITPKRLRVRRRLHLFRLIGTANFCVVNPRAPVFQPGPATRLRLRKSLWKRTTRWSLPPNIRIGRPLRRTSRQHRFLPLRGRWKRRPSTKRKRTPSVMKNRRMRATTSSKKRRERPVRLPKSARRWMRSTCRL